MARLITWIHSGHNGCLLCYEIDSIAKVLMYLKRDSRAYSAGLQKDSIKQAETKIKRVKEPIRANSYVRVKVF